jgi:multidrug efflux pump subunit AcrA (membrane-fusion protein)
LSAPGHRRRRQFVGSIAHFIAAVLAGCRARLHTARTIRRCATLPRVACRRAAEGNEVKTPWRAGLAVLAGVAAVAGLVLSGKLGGETGASGAAQATSVGQHGHKPEPPLEFSPREVVKPTLARMAAMVEFSGPLVAPRTAIVRAKASGTLLALSVAEGGQVAAGQAIGRIELAELGSRVAERSAVL